MYKNSYGQESHNKSGVEPNFFLSDRLIVPIKQYKFTAWCRSEACNRKALKTHRNLGCIRYLPKFTEWCPLCNNAIFWQKEEIK